MAIDLSTLEWGYRNYAGGDSSNQKATYSLNFNSGGQAYTFIPTSVVNKGVDAGDNNYVLPWFLSQDNMGELGKNSQYVDLSGQSWYGDYLKDTIGASTTGFLIPAGALPFDSKVSVVKQDVKGIAQTEDGPAYILEPPAGKSAQYVKANGNVTTITPGRSILGKVFGGIGDDLAGAFNDTLSSINELGPWANLAISIAYPPAGAAIAAANAGQGAMTGAPIEDVALNAAKAVILSNAGDGLLGSSTDPNAVGGVTGPDNIDVGGGWSPATGATAAELEAARLALEPAPVTPEYVAPAPAPTVDAITNDIANSADNIDAGGGFNPATGTGDAATAAAAAANPPIIPSVDSVVDEIVKGNADKSALYSNAGYGDTMTSAQIDAYDKAIAAGMTVSDALNYARVGLLVNAFVGDPLGLSGSQPNGTAAPTGFAQVEIPAEWKSPTYAASSAPIDLNSIFSNQNMLGGTQWQNLPNQQNMSFNDIFASGQQQTPMGTPVDINQIVSSILGQAATSQKPA
jgi:hypothetical protein